MSSIVIELQQETMSSQTKVSDLLRKALVVATKLEINEFKKWIENELYGYKEGDPIPQYRQLSGEIKACDPYCNWQPVIIRNASTAELLSSRKIPISIGELEDLLCKSQNDNVFTSPFPPDIRNEVFSNTISSGLVPALVIGKSKVFSIIEAVRNIILKWSLELEKDGILGEGLTFSDKEKQIASLVTYNIQNFVGVLGNVQTENLQIGDYNTIHAELKRLGVPQKERNELENILDGLKEPDKEKKKNLLKRGGEWLKRNAQLIGTLSETIRKWFELVS